MSKELWIYLENWGGGGPCKDRQLFSVTWPWRLKNPSTFSEREDVRTKRWQHRSSPGREVSWVRVDKKPERCPGESLCRGHGRPKTLMWREYYKRNKAGLLFEHLLFISHCVIKIVLNLTSFILLLLYQLINPTLRLLFYGERNWIEQWLIWPRQINISHWPLLNCDWRFLVTPNAKSSDAEREGQGNKTISSLQAWN